MPRRASIVFLCLAWLCANGALWNVVQVVAWGKMFRDYSTYLSWDEAVVRTFDGSAPCAICRVAQQGEDARRDGRGAAVAHGPEQLVLACTVETVTAFRAPLESWPRVTVARGQVRAEVVPVPPPRA